VPAPFEIFRTKKLLMPFGSDATVALCASLINPERISMIPTKSGELTNGGSRVPSGRNLF
jgi:hypothetical protein